MKGKEQKKTLTVQEKEELKVKKRYTIFSRSRGVTVILFILTSVCAISVAAGMLLLGAAEGKSNADGSMGGMEGAAIFMILLGFVGVVVIPLNMYHRKSLSLITTGVIMWDVGVVTLLINFSVTAPGIIGAAVTMLGGFILWITERARDKKAKNNKFNLREDFLLDTLQKDDAEQVLKTIVDCSNLSTSYKARLYYTLSILFASMTGLGFFMPFGKRAYLYNKAIAFINGESKYVGDANEKQKQVIKNYGPFGLFTGASVYYLAGKRFEIKYTPEHEIFRQRAVTGKRLGIFYIWYTIILRKITLRTTFNKKDGMSAGIMVYSANRLAELDPKVLETLQSYASMEKDDNKQDFNESIEKAKVLGKGISNWIDKKHEEYLEEKAKEEAEEEEKFEKARRSATSASVVTDGQNYYVQKTYGDTSSNKKLESYDEKTGVGTYVDESGNRVKIKNDN